MNLHKEILDIKFKRDQFLKSFSPGEVSTNDIENASIEDGGGGAFYVYLRKNTNNL